MISCYIILNQSISMGNSNEPNQLEYKIVKAVNHPILGFINYVSLRKQSSSSCFLCKTKTFTSTRELQTSLKKIKRREQMYKNSQINHNSYIISICHLVERQASTYCSNIQQLSILYEPIHQDLQQEFINKKCNRQTYSQEQILNLLTQLFQALHFAQQQQLKLFHVGKNSILKRRETNYCLTAYQDAQCLHPVDEYTHNFNGNLFSKNYYLSPKQLININRAYLPLQYSSKDHVFTLGMNVINLCLMKELTFQSDIIQVRVHQKEKYFAFDADLVKKQVLKIKRMLSQINYSDKLKQILWKMIEVEQQKRLTYSQFCQMKEQGYKEASLTDEIQLKKTLKRFDNKHFERKENIIIIPPSQENLQSNQNKVNPFEPKLTLQQNNISIATQAKNYKRAKLSNIKMDNINMALNATSQQPYSPSIFTPIKKLNDHLVYQSYSDCVLQGIKYGRAESIYDIESKRTIKNSLDSRTSFAFNLPSAL